MDLPEQSSQHPGQDVESIIGDRGHRHDMCPVDAMLRLQRSDAQKMLGQLVGVTRSDLVAMATRLGVLGSGGDLADQ